VKHFDDLLGLASTAKKGAMKTAAAASRAGTIRQVTTKHMGDGQQLSLNLQVRALSTAARLIPQSSSHSVYGHIIVKAFTECLYHDTQHGSKTWC
jgi:mevalonate pyrophosphate decarboxylase